jgi:hypothetical protein
MPATRGAPRRSPRDLTGRTDDDLKRAHADEIEQAGQEMAMATAAPPSRKRSKEVTDYTDAARPKVEPKPVFEQPAEPREYVVRLVASIEDMTFGREIIDPGDFSDPNSPRMPLLGGLKTYNFTEGKLYKVDEPLYLHLRDLGYLYDDED